MGGDHGHTVLPKIPDYRIYKVEDCPQLMKTKRMLAQHGLKDPWLRNEVWRYPPESRDPYYGLKCTMFRKVKLGFALAAFTVIAEKTYHHFFPEQQHHH